MPLESYKGNISSVTGAGSHCTYSRRRIFGFWEERLQWIFTHLCLQTQALLSKEA